MNKERMAQMAEKEAIKFDMMVRPSICRLAINVYT